MPPDDTEAFQHYRVLRRDDGSLWKLGAGAMGVTYKAIDTNLDAPVALKVINALYTGSDSARERFQREARAAASLRHRNVASVYHLGHDAQSFFYAMEFIDGETVEHLVAREGPQSWRVALPAALQVARALMAAHEKRLVHRDIKPANVMLVREVGEDDLTVKLIDFGLAKSLVEENGSVVNVTGTGFLGTPLYASPEQCEEIAPDIRSDIYSLGVTLWFVLAGRAPFQGGLGKVFAQHLHAPPPWNQLPASVPEPVRALLARMLAKDRDERPQTPADLRREIEACLRESGQSVPTLPGSEAPPLRPAAAPPSEPLVAETLLDPPPDAEPTGFTLEDALRQSEGRLPAALVADLLTPLAQILDAAAPAALDLAPGAVRVVAAPPGSAPNAAAFTDPWLTGGQPGRLELRPADAARPASPSVNETLPPRRAGFHAPAAALAALAYELIGGRPPAAGQDYRPLAECGEAANRHLRRALTDPAAPFAAAGAFAAAFARSLDHRAATEVPAAAPTPLPAAPTAVPTPPKKKRGCAVNVVVTLVAALLVVAVVGKLVLSPGAGPSTALTGQATLPAVAPTLVPALPPTAALTPTQQQRLATELATARGAFMTADWQACVTAYTQVLELTPDSLEAYFERGSAYSSLGVRDKAKADCTVAVRLEPKDARDHFYRGNANELLGDRVAAKTDYATAAAMPAVDAYEYLVRGRTYSGLSKYEEAIDNLTFAIHLNPQAARAYYSRGVAYEGLQKYEEAVKDYTEAIRLNPQYARAFNLRGNAYNGLQKYEEAIKDCTEAIRLDPQYNVAYYNRGNAYNGLQKYEEAIKDYTEAIRLDPQYAFAFNNRGAAYNSLQKYEEAIKDCTEAIRLNPQYALAFANRAKAYRALGRNEEAAQDEMVTKQDQK